MKVGDKVIAACDLTKVYTASAQLPQGVIGTVINYPNLAVEWKIEDGISQWNTYKKSELIVVNIQTYIKILKDEKRVSSNR
jgi:hypothetical protein